MLCPLTRRTGAEGAFVETMQSEAAEPGGGGALGASALHVLYLRKKCPFSGMKVPCFHRIEVPFLQNLSALFGQCPLTFEVLPRPLDAVNALRRHSRAEH